MPLFVKPSRAEEQRKYIINDKLKLSEFKGVNELCSKLSS